jgi:hypothetical protein
MSTVLPCCSVSGRVAALGQANKRDLVQCSAGAFAP